MNIQNRESYFILDTYKIAPGNIGNKFQAKTKSEKLTASSGTIFIIENKKINVASRVPNPEIEIGRSAIDELIAMEIRRYQYEIFKLNDSAIR